MSITFSGINYDRMRVTPYGKFPARVYLNDNHEADLEDCRNVNMANLNARAFLSFLGLDGDDLWGELPIPEVRRLIIRARNTFEHRAHRFVRHPETLHGAARTNPDGTVALRPIRVWIGGIDEEYLWRQLDRLEVLVDALAVKGATHLRWG